MLGISAVSDSAKSALERQRELSISAVSISANAPSVLSDAARGQFLKISLNLALSPITLRRPDSASST
jgi:hypothetical protein